MIILAVVFVVMVVFAVVVIIINIITLTRQEVSIPHSSESRKL